MQRIIITAILIIVTSSIYAQVVYEDIHKNIYNYLDKISAKGIVEINDNFRPLSRKYIAVVLNKINESKQQLTNTERTELKYYIQEYTDNSAAEIETSTEKYKILRMGKNKRFDFFDYEDSLFKININPILGVSAGSYDDQSYNRFLSGIKLYGTINSFIGFSFDYQDYWNIDRKLFDREYEYSSRTGAIWHQDSGFSEVHTHLGVDWQWGKAVIGKEFLSWGYGESNKLVLSDNAPSFPFLRLDISPVEWLDFNYILASLNSDVIDSTETYKSLRQDEMHSREQYRSKYFALHSITFKPAKGLKLSLGESIIFSDRFEPIYLMPLMFFRLADHYVSQNNNDAGGNSQFFLEVSSRNHIPKTHLYGTLFIDEIKIANVFDNDKSKNQFGFMLGISRKDFLLNDLDITVEYTRVNPFPYKHYISTLLYSNSSYSLANWIGHNAHMMYGSLQYKPFAFTSIKLWGSYIERGSEGNADMQFELPQPDFLFGETSEYLFYGAEIEYRPLTDLKIKASYKYKDIAESLERAMNLNPNRKEQGFKLSVTYGM